MKRSLVSVQIKGGNKRRCWALTKQVRRCTRTFYKGWLFCPAHRLSGWFQLITLVTGFTAFLANITQLTGNPLFAVNTATTFPRADKLYYVFVVDASSRMSAIFDGDKTKWDATRDAALGNLLYGLPAKANYGLIVLGGTNEQAVASCDSVTMSASFATENRDKVGDIIKAQQASGLAPVAKAFDLARDQLLGLPDDVTATNIELFVFLGGGDTCSDNDLQPILFFLQNSAKYLTNTHVDIFLLSNENIEEQILAEIENSNKEIDNVEVKITTSIVDLEAAVDQSFQDAQERAQTVEATTIPTRTTNVVQNVTATGGILTITPSETATPSPIPTTPAVVNQTLIVIEGTNFIQNITATGGILTTTASATATPSPIPNTSYQAIKFAEVVEGKIP
jgi:hypothetical protein